MKPNTVITISRQYGSGGRIIGKMLAEALGVPFYDNELITMAAEQTGLSKECFQEAESTSIGNLLLSLTSLTPGADSYGLPLNEKIFLFQSQVIKDVAAKGSCVIVGRCADYVLAGKFPTLNIFIHSDMPYKVERSVAEHGLDRDKAAAILTRRDKARAHHYRFYTDKKWGDARNYDLCLDSGKLGVETCVSIIVDTYRLLQHKA